MANETQHHPFAKVLRWIADGKKVEMNVGAWQPYWVSASAAEVLGWIVEYAYKVDDFRLAPGQEES